MRIRMTGQRPYAITVFRLAKLGGPTHPRLRKSPEEKFALAVQRIVDSRLRPIEKYELVELHTKRLQFLKEERGEQL